MHGNFLWTPVYFFYLFFFNTGEKPVCFEGLCFVIYGAHLKENGKEEKG